MRLIKKFAPLGIFFKFNPIARQVYYLFLIVMMYLFLGAIAFWFIERHFQYVDCVDGESFEDALDRLWRDQYLPRDDWKTQVFHTFSRWSRTQAENSRAWSLFDAAAYSYSLLSGTNCGMEPNTRVGKIFSMMYTLLTLPFLLLLTEYVTKLVFDVFLQLAEIAAKFFDTTANLVNDDINPVENHFNLGGLKDRWFLSLLFLLLFAGVGSWFLLYCGPYTFSDVFYDSFYAFATMSVGKSLYDANNYFVILPYVVIGIGLFQNFINLIQTKLKNFFTPNDTRYSPYLLGGSSSESGRSSKCPTLTNEVSSLPSTTEIIERGVSDWSEDSSCSEDSSDVTTTITRNAHGKMEKSRKSK